jgi:hypothetical protein
MRTSLSSLPVSFDHVNTNAPAIMVGDRCAEFVMHPDVVRRWRQAATS